MNGLVVCLGDGAMSTDDALMSIAARIGSQFLTRTVIDLSADNGLRSIYRTIPEKLLIAERFSTMDPSTTTVILWAGLEDAKREPPPALWMDLYALVVRTILSKRFTPILVLPPELPEGVGLKGPRRWIRRVRTRISQLGDEKMLEVLDLDINADAWLDSTSISNDGYHGIASQIAKAIA